MHAMASTTVHAKLLQTIESHGKFSRLEGENKWAPCRNACDEVEYGWVVLPHQTSMTDRCPSLDLM